MLSSRQDAGFDTHLHDLGNGDYQKEYGKVSWGYLEFTLIYIGGKIDAFDPLAYNAWGVTNNFSQTCETACLTIKHLASKGRPVVVGGSDAIAESPFLQLVLPQSYWTNQGRQMRPLWTMC